MQRSGIVGGKGEGGATACRFAKKWENSPRTGISNVRFQGILSTIGKFHNSFFRVRRSLDSRRCRQERRGRGESSRGRRRRRKTRGTHASEKAAAAAAPFRGRKRKGIPQYRYPLSLDIAWMTVLRYKIVRRKVKPTTFGGIFSTMPHTRHSVRCAQGCKG